MKEEKKNPWYKKAWNWFNGKKTTIGFALVSGSELIPDPKIKVAVQILGVVIGGTGVAHKLQKGELKK